MRVVGTEISGLDSDGQVAAERRDYFSDLFDGDLDALGDRRTRSFGLRAGPARPSAQASGASQLPDNDVQFVLRLGDPLWFIKSLGLLQILAQLRHSAQVLGLCASIENRASLVKRPGRGLMARRNCSRHFQQRPD